MIEYKVVERENPVTRQKVYYAQVARVRPLTLDKIAELIEKRSTVSSADIKAVLDALQFEILNALEEGFSVRLGDVGSFRATLTSRSAESAEAFLPSNIKGIRVRFTPSAKLNEELTPDKVSVVRMAEAPDAGADEEGGL